MKSFLIIFPFHFAGIFVCSGLWQVDFDNVGFIRFLFGALVLVFAVLIADMIAYPKK